MEGRWYVLATGFWVGLILVRTSIALPVCVYCLTGDSFLYKLMTISDAIHKNNDQQIFLHVNMQKNLMKLILSQQFLGFGSL